MPGDQTLHLQDQTVHRSRRWRRDDTRIRAFIWLGDGAESGEKSRRGRPSFLSPAFSRSASRRFCYLGHRTKSTPGASCLDVVGEWIALQGGLGRERGREREARSSTGNERRDSWQRRPIFSRLSLRLFPRRQKHTARRVEINAAIYGNSREINNPAARAQCNRCSSVSPRRWGRGVVTRLSLISRRVLISLQFRCAPFFSTAIRYSRGKRSIELAFYEVQLDVKVYEWFLVETKDWR